MTTKRTLFVALLMLMTGVSNAADICRTFNFKGFDAQTRAAEAVIGAPVTGRKQMKVYITVVNSQLFAQTNYLIPGTESPTKLAIDNKTSLDVIVWNLITDDPAKVTHAEAARAIRDDITFFVDRFRLNQSQFSDLDFTQAKKVIWDPSPSLPNGASGPLLTAEAGGLSPTAAVGSSVVTTPAVAASEPIPKNMTEAAIQVLWTSSYGKFAIVVAAALAALLAILAALPDAVKQTLFKKVGMGAASDTGPVGKKRRASP